LHDGNACEDDNDCIGGWINYKITDVSDDDSSHTRPAIVWDFVNECLYYFATDRESAPQDAVYEIVERRTEFSYHVSPTLPVPSWSTQEVIMTDLGSTYEANLNNVSVPKGPFWKDVIGVISSNHDHTEDEGFYHHWLIDAVDP
jgi:hypothetical protein